MALLGVAYTLAYEGKNFSSGLTDVSAIVLKPNGSLIGPIPLPEVGALPGLYTGSLITTLTDPVGEWLATIISPSEGIRDTHRISFQVPTFTYVNRMTTNFNTTTGVQEVLVWAEREGQAVSGTNCSIQVKTSTGTVLWSQVLSSPGSDGIFRFTNAVSLVVQADYYIVISITVDGQVRTNQQPFFTVG